MNYSGIFFDLKFLFYGRNIAPLNFHFHLDTEFSENNASTFSIFSDIDINTEYQ